MSEHAEKVKTLSVIKLCKYFAGLKALEEVSFELQSGEILGLIGPNGSGKTTAINVVTGLLPPSSGTIKINERDITGFKAHQTAKAGLARTFQTIRLFKGLTVYENVEVAAVSLGVKRREAEDLSYELLRELGLEEVANQMAGELSYGHQRKLEIARALALEPQFIFLDEPAAGLNEEESDDILALLRKLPQGRNLGVLIVDHDMRLIMRLCDRLHVLDHGLTIAEGTPAAIRANQAVMDAYFGSHVEKES
ncbi:MAG TPA: ABC transporter ATP-binding protein [Clostridia bacterium]|nr:ABC transporter ATP-binding protein [Clostridia bacterium]